jgi:hypothetical protein
MNQVVRESSMPLSIQSSTYFRFYCTSLTRLATPACAAPCCSAKTNTAKKDGLPVSHQDPWSHLGPAHPVTGSRTMNHQLANLHSDTIKYQQWTLDEP